MLSVVSYACRDARARTARAEACSFLQLRLRTTFLSCSIDLLKEQVKQLNGEVEQFTKEIEQLYDRYYFEEEDKKAQRLKTQIDEMREDRKRLTDNREALMTQLKAGGM